MDNLTLGRKGEKFAAKFLRKNKYKLWYTNFRTDNGEIDIISETDRYLVFTEVKTRTEGQMLEPSAAVDYNKRQRIFKAATAYIKLSGFTKQPRFDIAEVICHSDGKLSINYIENAFGQEKDYAVF